MATRTYVPPTEVLEKYADVLVNFALGSGEGIKKGEVVQLVVPDIAKELGRHLRNAVIKSGGHPIVRLYPTDFEREFYELASEEQLKFFPKKYLKARADLIDHTVSIIADPNPRELQGVDAAKILMARDSAKQVREWLTDKENKGKFTWTLGLWGVAAKAEEVGLSLREYWDQIIQACFLDQTDPVAQWRKVWAEQEKAKAALNALEIDSLHVVGPDADLTVKLGPERLWCGGSGRNIPSFELFTSPDWRGTEGWIQFNQPLYRYGQVIRDIRLEFRKGLVVKAHARRGNEFLQQMLKSPNANKIGEYSLTDKRFSRITHTMAETLFDENIGGPFGNTHLAVGMAYNDCYRGDPSKLSKAQWRKLGYNQSAEHTDIVSTTDRTVTATLTNGVQKVIYRDGMFVE